MLFFAVALCILVCKDKKSLHILVYILAISPFFQKNGRSKVSPAGSVGASAYFRMQRSPPETRAPRPKTDSRKGCPYNLQIKFTLRLIHGTTQGSFPTPVGADAIIRPQNLHNRMVPHNPRRGRRLDDPREKTDSRKGRPYNLQIKFTLRLIHGTTQRSFPTPVGADAIIRPQNLHSRMVPHNPRRGRRLDDPCEKTDSRKGCPYDLQTKFTLRLIHGTTQRSFPTPVGADAIIRPQNLHNRMVPHTPRRGRRLDDPRKSA